MALNRATDRFLATLDGNVLKTGGSLNLAKGQLGIFDIKSNTRNGLAAVSNFAGLSKDKKFEIRVGTHQNPATRTGDSYSKSTRAFSLRDIESLTVHVPSTKKKVDEILVGYDGINDDTALTFETGDSEELDIGLCGDAIGALGFPKSSVNVKLYFDKLNDDETDQEIVEKAVETAKRTILVDNIPLSDYVDIIPVNSENTALTGTSYKFKHLKLNDAGDSNALAQVQAQYNGMRVEMTEHKNGVSTYTVLTEGSTLPTAFSVKTVDYLETCDTCPNGYETQTDGYLYSLTFQDDGDDDSSDVENFTNWMSDTTVTKIGQEGAMGTYLAVFTKELTNAEITALTTLATYGKPSLEMELVLDIKAACMKETTTTVAWVAGEECFASTDEYYIQLKDNDCGNSRVAELQAKYPDLNVQAEGTTGACQRKYKATVVTEVVCTECSDEIQDLFVSEAPTPYEKVEWTKKEKNYDPDAKMGILFRAKETVLVPNEGLRDAVPFIHTSVKLSIAGGYNTGVFENFKKGQGRFAVKVLSTQEDLENLGGNLWVYEDRDLTYFRGYPRLRLDNGFENEMRKQILGEESVLKPDAQYIIYTLTVRPELSQNPFVAQKAERFNYMIAVELGKHKGIEEVLNSLVGASGLPGVKAMVEDES